MALNTKGCDFIDFGSGVGGCIDFAKKKLRGGQELGIEIHPGRHQSLLRAGYNAVCADVSKISLPGKSVRFVTISHVLEHLDSLAEVQKVLRTAIHAAREFVFIEGPAFDFDKYLASLGLRFCWSAGGHDHTMPLTSRQIVRIVEKTPGVHSYTFLQEVPPVTDSSCPDLHPLTSPPGVRKYDAKIHPAKPRVKFLRPVYRSFIIFIWCKEPELSLLAARAPKFERATLW